MFLEKLWVRLRGELLAFKENLADDKDLRESAERLLEKLETRLRATEAQGPQRQEQSRGSLDKPGQDSSSESLRSIEKEWQDLQRRRRQQDPESEDSVPPEQNPRKLG